MIAYSGFGNSFFLAFQEPESASNLCQKSNVDGLIVIQQQADHHRLKIINKDGSIASMCGNGLCCVAQYLFDLQKKSNFIFQTEDGIYPAEIRENKVHLFFPPPKKIQLNKKLFLEKKEINYHFIHAGVPHAILFADYDHVVAKAIRHHKDFPKGINVNFITPIDQRSYRFQTFERGVEDQTLACGTGAIATSIAFFYHTNQTPPFQAITSSNENYQINFTISNNQLINFVLQGQAKRIFETQEI